MDRKNLNIIGYERVSTDSQVENGLGLQIQSSAIEKYTKDNGYTLLKIFSEKGVSGSLEDRPALGEMIKYLEENKNAVDEVVFLRLDRLSRTLMLQESLIDELKKLDVMPVSIEEPNLCSTDPSRILFRQIRGSISEYEKKMITIRLSAGRKKKVETEKNYGSGKPAYGYEVVNGKYQPIENQIKIVKEIHRLRRKPKHGKQLSYEKVKQVINEKYSDVKRFSVATIHYIANNSFYRGNIGYAEVNVFNPQFKIV